MKNLCLTLIAIVALVVCSPLSAVADTWGDQVDPSLRFTVLPGYASTAVRDNETGLVWEQSPATFTRSWVFAQDFCNTRNVGNRLGWRLPTVQELASLVDPTQVDPSLPALPAGHPFSNVQSDLYWSATTASFFGGTGDAWVVCFIDGDLCSSFVVIKAKNIPLLVWCVRGGQGVNPQ